MTDNFINNRFSVNLKFLSHSQGDVKIIKIYFYALIFPL